jgi:putative N-acetyltransferase (TIGR04045 family)
MFERVLPFVSPTTAVVFASEPWHGQGSRGLRRSVFVAEQGVFMEDDRDEHDHHALTIVALSVVLGMHDRVIGTVRIYEDGDRTWYGGRLAVAAEYRRFSRVGERLTIAAVSTAKLHGAARFLATVQEPNVAFFQRQHFRLKTAGLTLHGRPHALMEADLGFFSAADACVRSRAEAARASTLPAHVATSAA